MHMWYASHHEEAVLTIHDGNVRMLRLKVDDNASTARMGKYLPQERFRFTKSQC